MTIGCRRSTAVAALVLGVLVLPPAASAEPAVQTATAPALDRDTAQWLATLPLSCLGKPHAAPRSRGYPLAKVFLERIPPYLNTLAAPMRVGTHGNTAYATFITDYLVSAHRTPVATSAQ